MCLATPRCWHWPGELSEYRSPVVQGWRRPRSTAHACPQAHLLHSSAEPHQHNADVDSLINDMRTFGGATSLENYGVWVENSGETWVALRRGAAYRSIPPTSQLVECDFKVDPGRPWRVSLLGALLQYCRKISRNTAVAASASALHVGLLSQEELTQLGERLSRRCRPWLRRVNGRAESGLETLLRLACEDQGWDVEIQVPFRGGHVDIVINWWLFIEADGSQLLDVTECRAKRPYIGHNLLGPIRAR